MNRRSFICAGFAVLLFTSCTPTISTSIRSTIDGPPSLSKSILTVSAMTVASGSSVTLTLTTYDESNLPLVRGGHAIAFSHSGGTSTGTFGITVDHGNGTYTSTFTGINAGSETSILTSLNGSTLTSTPPAITVIPGPAAQLLFTTQPTQTLKAVAIAPSVELTLKDANNNITTNSATPVTLAIANNAGGATLAGTTTTSPVNGVAAFSDIFLNKAGSGYTLRATSGTLTSTESAAFDILSLAPTDNTITTDRLLEKYVFVAGSGITPPGTGIAPTLGGVTPPLGGAGDVGGLAAVGSGEAPALGGVIGTGAGMETQPPNGLSATITINSIFPSGAVPACSVLTPFQAVNCSLPNFLFIAADLTATGGLQIRTRASNGQADDYLDSNTLPTKKYEVSVLSNTWGDANLTDFLDPLHIGTLNGEFYFNAYVPGFAYKLYKTDGTTLTRLSNTSNNPGNPDDPQGLIAFNGYLYFSAYNSNSVRKLYKTDGTTITQVSNTTNNQSTSDSPYATKVYDNWLYFSAANSAGGFKLFKTDGSNITQVSNTSNNQAAEDSPSWATVFNNRLYFVASNSFGAGKIYKTDGNSVTQVSNTTNNQASSDLPSGLKVSSGILYFTANSSAGVRKLFKTDGSTLTLVSNTRNNPNASDDPSQLTDFEGTLYFVALNINNVPKLYKTDGSTITQVSNTANHQSVGDSPSGLTVYNHRLYFAARNPNAVFKLYSTDGMTITQISNTRNSNVQSDSPFALTALSGGLYFGSRDLSGFTKLFKTDGSSVIQITDINSGGHDLDAAPVGCNFNGVKITEVNGIIFLNAYAKISTCAEKIIRIKPN